MATPFEKLPFRQKHESGDGRGQTATRKEKPHIALSAPQLRRAGSLHIIRVIVAGKRLTEGATDDSFRPIICWDTISRWMCYGSARNATAKQTTPPASPRTREGRGCDMHTIFCFNNGGSPGFMLAVAVADDGHCLAEHCCSHEGYMRHDLGMDGSTWKHEHYNEHFGAGNWQLEWVSNPNQRVFWPTRMRPLVKINSTP